MNELTIRLLKIEDAESIAEAFSVQGWDKPASQYVRYFEEMQVGTRVVWVAEWDGWFAGYVTLVWESGYPPFRERKIPEIVDLNVLQTFQRRGIASALMDAAEQKAAERSLIVGLGVGLTADYGNAQRMYIKRGYVFDGKGISQNGKFLRYGDQIQVDDDLVLCLTKPVTPHRAEKSVTETATSDPKFQSKLKSIQEMLENL